MAKTGNLGNSGDLRIREKSSKRKRGGLKRRRTVLFQDGLGALSVAAFLFLGATIREVNLLMALGSFFAGFAALDYWGGRRTLRRLRVARKLPDAIFADEPFAVEIEIDATARRASAWGVVVEDEWAPQDGERANCAFTNPVEKGELSDADKKGEAAKSEKKEKRKKKGEKEERGEIKRKKRAAEDEVAQPEFCPNVAATERPTAYFPRIKGGERRKERYWGVVARRGVRRLETLTASTRFPCGFFRSSERFDAPDEILVFPKIGVLTERWDASVGVAKRETTAPTARSTRIAGETLAVRDWRPGDSKQAIHWRATAKRDKLQVRDFEKRENSVKILILDLFFEDEEAFDRDARRKIGENSKSRENGRVAANGATTVKKKDGQDKKRKAEAATAEIVRRSELVEKAISFAATLVERWTRSNDARLLLIVNGETSWGKYSEKKECVETLERDERGKEERKYKQVKTGEVSKQGVLGKTGVEGGASAFRRALTRLATVEAPRRDRLAELVATLDPRVGANAQVFVVSVAPFDGERLERRITENAVATGKTSDRHEKQYVDKIENREDGASRENRGEPRERGKLDGEGAVAWAAERGVGGRWRDARLVDVSAFDFDDYFAY